MGRVYTTGRYVLESEKNIGLDQPGPHKGGDNTTAYNFFEKAPGFKMVFRKRVLHQGSSIGYHLQKEDEIYYILSGNGNMKMNGELLTVSAGDAILTRGGSSHSLTPSGKDGLALIIAYLAK